MAAGRGKSYETFTLPNGIWTESVVDFQLQSTLVAGIVLFNLMITGVIPFDITYSKFLNFKLIANI
jgi:hypothetical protein